MEIMHATNCSNGERNPASASSNMAAFGHGRTAVSMRSSARSMSNGCLLTGGSTASIRTDAARVGEFLQLWQVIIHRVVYDIGLGQDLINGPAHPGEQHVGPGGAGHVLLLVEVFEDPRVAVAHR